jgi:hypothetical protein
MKTKPVLDYVLPESVVLIQQKVYEASSCSNGSSSKQSSCNFGNAYALAGRK